VIQSEWDSKEERIDNEVKRLLSCDHGVHNNYRSDWLKRSIYQHTIYLSIYLSIYLFIYLQYLSIYLSVYSFIYSMYLLMHPSIYLFNHNHNHFTYQLNCTREHTVSSLLFLWTVRSGRPSSRSYRPHSPHTAWDSAYHCRTCRRINK